MEQQSPHYLTKQLDNQISRALSRVDLRAINNQERELIAALRQNLQDAKSYVRDYELSETRQEQLKEAKEATKLLKNVRKYVLELSEYDYFNPVDVAHLTAQIEQITEKLR